MKHTPQTIGALQAIGLVLYIMLFATGVQTVSSYFPDKELGPQLGITLFLLLFVTSALICSSIALGYPIKLFFVESKRSEAMHVVGWTIGWLLAFGLLFIVYLFIYGPLLQ
ncbi:MAG: hypothetical protein RL681_562 [Candidatus Parcubacteria bacterium]|jgi:glucan phosphoethanolaminetransferase (alkaline phosphatase superfamily)